MRRSHLVGFTIVVIWDTIIHEKRSSEKHKKILKKCWSWIYASDFMATTNSKTDWISERLERFERFNHLDDLIVGVDLNTSLLLHNGVKSGQTPSNPDTNSFEILKMSCCCFSARRVGKGDRKRPSELTELTGTETPNRSGCRRSMK